MAPEVGHGSCICGDVKYTFSESPALSILCHCITCRKFSSSTNPTFILLPFSSLDMTTPTPLATFSAKHESGLVLTWHWCTKCGTKIYKETDSPDHKGVVLVAAGTLDPDSGLRLEDLTIGKEFYIKDRVGWLSEKKGAEQCQRFE